MASEIVELAGEPDIRMIRLADIETIRCSNR
jgi:hypothetical protein